MIFPSTTLQIFPYFHRRRDLHEAPDGPRQKQQLRQPEGQEWQRRLPLDPGPRDV